MTPIVSEGGWITGNHPLVGHTFIPVNNGPARKIIKVAPFGDNNYGLFHRRVDGKGYEIYSTWDVIKRRPAA